MNLEKVELKLNKIKFKSYNFLDFFKKFKIEKEIYEKNNDFIFDYFLVKFLILIKKIKFLNY